MILRRKPLSSSRLLPSWLLYAPCRGRADILSDGWGRGWQLPLDGRANGELGSVIYDDRVVQIIVLESIIILVHSLRWRKLLRLGKVDGIILQLLKCGSVEIVEIIVVEVVHFFSPLSPLSWSKTETLRLGRLCSSVGASIGIRSYLGRFRLQSTAGPSPIYGTRLNL